MINHGAPVEAYIAVGSNVDPVGNIPNAISRLCSKIVVVSTSNFYRTRPLARPEQPEFRNGVIKVHTSTPPEELKFEILRDIERLLGRIRTEDSHAKRTIDLDLLIYGDLVTNEGHLQLPDPDIRVRPFLAIPLLEVAPSLRLPDSGDTLRTLPVATDRRDLILDAELTELVKTRTST